MTIRTRFAPSPTGFLHIGGARTALYSYLYAKANKGKFVLRIEDTDTERSTKEYEEDILASMKWLGLDWDEGPFYQSKNVDIYKEAIDKLFENGMLYKCYCSRERLDKVREEAMKAGGKPKYDGKCREFNEHKDEPYVIRFKMPQVGQVLVNDLIKGETTFDNSELDDLIIVRQNGAYTYNFVVVIDDVEEKITHIVRGDDHLNNTPKQLHIYNALGAEPPIFAHLPMILGPDKQRLSKRHGATAVSAYKDAGYLPHAMLNYLLRLGWSHGDDEIFSKDEMVQKFLNGNLGKSSSIFDMDKFTWLNGHYIRHETDEKLVELLGEKHPQVIENKNEKVLELVRLCKERAKTINELYDWISFYFKDEIAYDETASQKFLKGNVLEPFTELYEKLNSLEDFKEEAVQSLFMGILEKHEIKLVKLAQPVRVALTGKSFSPGIFEVISILGKDRTISRLEKGLEFIKERVVAS
ncbi:MAG: glutamate--tRNA ligase [Pseudomonadota bacterium]